MSGPVRTYLGLYAHVLRLAGRGLARKWPYLFAAPVVWFVGALISGVLATTGGIAGGLLASLVRAAALSAVLFIGRAVIEQRTLSLEDLGQSLTAFFGDVLTVLFTVWVLGLVLGQAIGPSMVLFLFAALVLLPVPEVVALSTTGGFFVFREAWSFFQRDFIPWLLGNGVAVGLLALAWVAVRSLTGLLFRVVPVGASFVPHLLFAAAEALPVALALAAFVYRGILYLTLEGTSPRTRAERFGGAPTLR